MRGARLRGTNAFLYKPVLRLRRAVTSIRWRRVKVAFGIRARRAKGASLLVQLGGLFAGLGILTFGLWWFVRDQAWADAWLPNFVAEWSGIALALVVVDRLLEQQRVHAVTPLRRRAERSIAEYLFTLVIL